MAVSLSLICLWLQSRTKPEQEAIEDLLATYARVAVNSGAGGAIQVQQELDQYRALEHQMVLLPPPLSAQL